MLPHNQKGALIMMREQSFVDTAVKMGNRVAFPAIEGVGCGCVYQVTLK